VEDFGVFSRGSHGQRSDTGRSLWGKFAGILQVEIRQRVSCVRMLMIVACEGGVGSLHSQISRRLTTIRIRGFL
jgi:hypothetical protein